MINAVSSSPAGNSPLPPSPAEGTSMPPAVPHTSSPAHTPAPAHTSSQEKSPATVHSHSNNPSTNTPYSPTQHNHSAAAIHPATPHFPPIEHQRNVLDPTDPPRHNLAHAQVTPDSVPSTPSSSQPPILVSSPSSTPHQAAFPPAPPTPGSGATTVGGNNPPNTPPKKSRGFSPKIAVAALAFALMLVGGAAGLYLTQENQDIRQQASESCRQVGESWNECCGAGLSKKVTCTGVGGAPACCNSWDVGECNQQDSICGNTGGNTGGDVCNPGDCQSGTETCWSDGTIACIKCNEAGNGWESSVQGTGRACVDGGAPDGGTCSNAGVNSTSDDAALCVLQGGTVSSEDPHDCPSTGGVACAKDGGIACAYADPRQPSCGVIGGGWPDAENSNVTWNGSTLINNSANSISITVCRGPDPDDNPGCPISNNCSPVTVDPNGGTYTMSQCEQVDSPDGSFGGQCIDTGCESPSQPPTEPPPAPPAPPPAQKIPVGQHDLNTCTFDNSIESRTVEGWACDPDKPDAKLSIHFYLGDASNQFSDRGFIGATTANIQTAGAENTNIQQFCGGGDGNNRFRFVIPPNTQDGRAISAGEYIHAFAIDIDAAGTLTNNNPKLTNSPQVIASCATQPPAPKPTASFSAVCRDNVAPTGLRYDLTISNITGSNPFNSSDIFLSFPPSKQNARIKQFLGVTSYNQNDEARWYGYRLYKGEHSSPFFTSWTSGNLTTTWDSSFKIGLGGKTIQQLADQMTAWQNDPSISQADRTALKNYRFNIAANLAMAEVFNDTIGSKDIEISTTACTTPIGPMCMLITTYTVDANNAVSSVPANLLTLKLNDKIAFKCGGNSAATTANYTYQFRLLESLADGSKRVVNNVDLNNRGAATSRPFTITQAKTYFAECRICKPVFSSVPGGEVPDPVCQEWYHTL